MEEFIKNKELDELQKSFSNLGNKLNTTSLEANKEYVTSTERVGWFSAATISLSFTLIGYLMSRQDFSIVLKENFLNINIISILIVAWMSLCLSVIASLFTRRFNASLLQYSDLFHWSSEGKKLKQKMIELIDIGSTEIIFTDAGNKEQAKVNLTKSEKDYKDTAVLSQKKKNLWLKVSNITQAFVYVGAVFGIILLVIFITVVIYKVT